MTDRLNGCSVVFEQDIREDDAKSILKAIRMVKGVLAVEPNVADISDFVAQQRVRSDLSKKLWKALEDK